MIHSFLLIGQSNMAGRGYINEAEHIDDSRIYILRNGRWQNMFRPIHPDRSFAGVCLAESFAEAYSKKYGVDVGLIPCADGGTSLEQWKEGGLLYENAVTQTRLAARTSTVVGILWHQGEADCAPELASSYKARFMPMINALCRDLGLEDVPLVLGELGYYLADCPLDEKLKNYVEVNEQLHLIAKESSKTGCASAEDLTSNDDFLHFNAKSLYKFGLRYFSEFERLYDKDQKFNEKESDITRTEMEAL